MPIKMPDALAGEPPTQLRVRPKTRLSGIEASRGVAATVVILYHAARHLDKSHSSPLLAQAFRFGHGGVDFFFVISGFIILHVHAPDIGRPARLPHYGARRFTRVFPTYWVALALTLVLGLAAHRHELPSAGYLADSVLLLPAHTAPLLGIAWTLQYEVVFYTVFAILVLNRSAGATLFALWLAWIVVATIVPQPFALPSSLYGAYNLEFFAGMAAAWLLGAARINTPLTLLYCGIASFAAAATAEDAGWLDGYSGLGRLAYGLPSVLIVLGAATADRDGRMEVPRILRILGAASYSIYLFQFIFIGLAWHALAATGLDRALPHFLCFSILAVFGVAGGVIMSRWVEYPLMRAARRGTK